MQMSQQPSTIIKNLIQSLFFFAGKLDPVPGLQMFRQRVLRWPIRALINIQNFIVFFLFLRSNRVKTRPHRRVQILESIYINVCQFNGRPDVIIPYIIIIIKNKLNKTRLNQTECTHEHDRLQHGFPCKSRFVSSN